MRKHRIQAKLHAARQKRFRNPSDKELSQQRHQADAERRRSFRNPDDEMLSQQRHHAEAERLRNIRLSGQEQRAQETPEEGRVRRQREYSERHEQQKSNNKACSVSKIFKGDLIVREHYIGSRTTSRGAPRNSCQH